MKPILTVYKVLLHVLVHLPFAITFYVLKQGRCSYLNFSNHKLRCQNSVTINSHRDQNQKYEFLASTTDENGNFFTKFRSLIHAKTLKTQFAYFLRHYFPKIR